MRKTDENPSELRSMDPIDPDTTTVAATRRRRSGPTGDATASARRNGILQAAERLFAEHGYHGVSIRDIAVAAGVPLALVGYYFGPKAQLYQTIFRERAGYIAERLRILAEARRNAPPERLLEEIAKAFVLPVLDLAATPDGRVFLRLLARGMNEQLAEDQPVIRELFDPLANAFIDAIAAAQPGVRRETAAWSYQFALGALLLHVTDERIPRLSPGSARQRNRARDLLVRFTAEGIRGACRQS